MLTCTTVAAHLCLCCIDQPTTSDNIYAKMRMSYLLIKIGLTGSSEAVFVVRTDAELLCSVFD